MTIKANSYDVLIAGAGPAGTSAAIHLAQHGVEVLLAEQKKFPRAKLCGEFISPECLDHFRSLGVAERMTAARPAHLTQTVFYSRAGSSVDVPSKWFNGERAALGLSRAEMDERLLQRARAVGVDVLEESQAAGLIVERGRVSGIELKSGDLLIDYNGLVTIDATGRTRALARRLESDGHAKPPKRRPFVAFKAHLLNARPTPGACEIYFYPGGYGGLSGVENGLSNLCFIVSANSVRECKSDPERVMREVVSRNSRAAYTLAHARIKTEWLGVSLESFGRQEPVPANGLMTIGDAAAFIDPFTGSGMLMALESGEIAAAAIVRHLQSLRKGAPFELLAREYRALYQKTFKQRLRVCALLRRAAFVPRLAEAAIRLCSASERVRRALARATRRS